MNGSVLGSKNLKIVVPTGYAVELNYCLKNDVQKIEEAKANPRNAVPSGSVFPKTGNGNVDGSEPSHGRLLPEELEVLHRHRDVAERAPDLEVSALRFCGGHRVRRPNEVPEGIPQNANGGVPGHLTISGLPHPRRSHQPRIKLMWSPVPVPEHLRLPRISPRLQDTRKALLIPQSVMLSWRTRNGKLLPTAKALPTTTCIPKTMGSTIPKIWCLKGLKVGILPKGYHWTIESTLY